MVSQESERIVKKVMNQGEYVQIPFCELKRGDVFMLYEADGTGLGRYVAKSDAFLNEDNIWTVEIING